jgi:hypothetical protein
LPGVDEAVKSGENQRRLTPEGRSAMTAVRTRAVAVGVVLLLAAALRADPDSGPAAGSKAPPLKATAAHGDDAGKEVDFVDQRKDRPTVFVLVRADRWGRPMYRFLRGVDEILKKERDDVRVVAVWVGDEPEKSKEYLERAEPTLKMLMQTTFAYAGKDGPKDWNVNADAHVTAVVVEGGKVAASLGFVSVNETDARDVVGKLKPKK